MRFGIYSFGMETIESTFRALSDKTRLRILGILGGAETCVGDLVEVLGVSQPVASRHLAYLRRAGLVEVRRQGLWAFYSVAPAEGGFRTQVLACVDACLQESAQMAADQIRIAELRAGGGCCPLQVVNGAEAKVTACRE